MLCDVVCFAYHTYFELDHSFLLHPSTANKGVYFASLSLLITSKDPSNYYLL